MTERENILTRIREALAVKSPLPGHARAPSPDPRHSPTLDIRLKTQDSLSLPLLPAVGNSFEDRLALFAKNAADLKADFQLVNSRDELLQKLVALCDRENWKKIGSHTGQLTDAACNALGLPICRTDKQYNAAELESCDAGITECDALVAQTGSVLVTSQSAGGRALSVLPPHHVVLARREQLLADLPEAFAALKRKYERNYPSFISLITGPSRTGDIERILVLGAHGPKKLTIFCM
jgi:L-lactate dehydrogenase complex protein LldG